MRWLSIDPGETVGWALWEDETLIDASQTPMWEFADQVLLSLVTPGGDQSPVVSPESPFAGIERIVMEDFVLYPADVGDGPPPPWDKVRTARLIGAIELAARWAEWGPIPVVLQGAVIKDVAEKAGATALFISPLHENRHANDAIRHGVYFMAMNGDITTPVTEKNDGRP